MIDFTSDEARKSHATSLVKSISHFKPPPFKQAQTLINKSAKMKNY